MNYRRPSAGLDLHSRALAALNNLAGNLDPNLGFQPYFWTIFYEEPVEARHDFCDFSDITGRYLDSLILVRRMTGAEQGKGEEEALKKLLVSYFSEGDGLSYRPATPWSHHDALLFDQSRVLGALVTWLQAGDSPEAERRLREHIDGLLRIAIREEGYLYFPWEAYPPHGWDPNYWPGDPFHIRPAESPYEGGVSISALVRAYELLSYEPALELARGLAEWNRRFGGVYQEDGSFWYGHFHARTATIAGIARLAWVTGDAELLAWARKAYDFARAQGTRYGFVPESDGNNSSCETCAITDLIEAALIFAQAGQVEPAARQSASRQIPRAAGLTNRRGSAALGSRASTECYGDVERIARNQLAEAQLLDASRVPTVIPFRASGGRPDTLQSSFDRVRERVQGGFAGWSKPNEWSGQDDWFGHRMMACCHGAGAKALYFLWAHAVSERNGEIRVNLWLDRNTPQASVRSALPDEGRLEVVMRDDADLSVRIPDGIAPGDITASVDGAPADLRIEGAYIQFTALRSGQTVEIRVPLGEYETTEHAGGQEYRVRWRGDTVMSVDPPGVRTPLYVRGTADTCSTPAPLRGSEELARAFTWW